MKKSLLKKTRAQNSQKIGDKGDSLTKIKNQAAEYLAGWQRAKADYKNLVARNEAQKGMLIKTATKDLVVELLPVIDNLERALQASDHGQHQGANHLSHDAHHNTGSKKTSKVVTKENDLREGVKLILKQMQAILKSRGVQKIECVGRAFDPAFHEAVARVKGPPGICVKEHVSGYRMGEIVFRPSRVDVGSQQDN